MLERPFPHPFYIELTMFSEMLVVTSWAALDTSLSPHDSTSLMKSSGNLLKGCVSVWEREQIL